MGTIHDSRKSHTFSLIFGKSRRTLSISISAQFFLDVAPSTTATNYDHLEYFAIIFFDKCPLQTSSLQLGSPLGVSTQVRPDTQHLASGGTSGKFDHTHTHTLSKLSRHGARDEYITDIFNTPALGRKTYTSVLPNTLLKQNRGRKTKA